jgi:hypothetical protein
MVPLLLLLPSATGIATYFTTNTLPILLLMRGSARCCSKTGLTEGRVEIPRDMGRILCADTNLVIQSIIFVNDTFFHVKNHEALTNLAISRPETLCFHMKSRKCFVFK